jgi:amino acid transporter
MYAFAPISLRALRVRDPERSRPYRLPAHRVLAPVAFVSANLIIYWSSYQAEWKLGLATVLGLVIFAITRATRPAAERLPLNWKASAWVWPWFIGMIVIGAFGRYGGGEQIPEWWDIAVVAVFALAIYFFGVRSAVSGEEVNAAVAIEEAELAAEPELKIA